MLSGLSEVLSFLVKGRSGMLSLLATKAENSSLR